MADIAALGRADTVVGYMALGFKVYSSDRPEELRTVLHSLARGGCAVIFIEEDFYSALAEDVAVYADAPLPAIIPIPGREPTLGIGSKALKSAAERAVGADILSER